MPGETGTLAASRRMGAGRARSGMVIAAATTWAAAGAVELACGGTTGQPADDNASTTPAVTVDAAGADAAGDASDATVGASSATGDDGGAFDVTIAYWDGTLPDISAPTTVTGADGASGYPWPNCPPWIPVGHRGQRAPGEVTGVIGELPADYTDAGDAGTTFAADGSACATYPWLGSTAVDQCVATSLTPGGSGWMGAFAASSIFPPCNWCEDAGVVGQGTAEGESRYSVCLALYQCIQQSGCGSNVISCLCGDQSSDTAACSMNANPSGPCAQEELAALEELPSDVRDAILNYSSTSSLGFPGVCGGTLNYIYSSANSYGCFPGDDE
jgi:hypothetical protein